MSFINIQSVKQKLADSRSGRVIFVSHCMLNQNVRYCGGASEKDFDKTAFGEFSSEACGLVQMPCPEVPAWGGINKALIWLPLGRPAIFNRFLQVFARPFFLLWTKVVFSRQAAGIVRLMQKYVKSGYEIIAVYGVDGSPSCGVNASLDLNKCFRYHSLFGKKELKTLSAAGYNAGLYRGCLVQGRGLFIRSLQKKMSAKKLSVQFRSVSLLKELGIK